MLLFQLSQEEQCLKDFVDLTESENSVNRQFKENRKQKRTEFLVCSLKLLGFDSHERKVLQSLLTSICLTSL